jgi:hypothetical protein
LVGTSRCDVTSALVLRSLSSIAGTVILILGWSAVVSSSTSRRTSQIFLGLILFHALRLIFDTAALPKIRTAVVGLFDRILNHEWTRIRATRLRTALSLHLSACPGHFLPFAICYLQICVHLWLHFFALGFADPDSR